MESRKCTVESVKTNKKQVERGEDNEEEGPLPGFRFHPTDEELVGFYLKRKVENKRPLSIEIIKQIDIYKHDPWDLAKASSSVGDREWYFYCKRGRKYRNSIRPNRVTGSGFWKATGIDKPVYSNGGEGHNCIGLKKSLVYYRGSAGKGTKTDWMMHEFRLPSDIQPHHYHHDQPYSLPNPNKDPAGQEAEIWTLCRIFKRNKKHTPDWRELSIKKNSMVMNSSSKTSSMDSSTNNQSEHYISFASLPNSNINTIISTNNPHIANHNTIDAHFHLNPQYQHQQQQHHQQQWSSVVTNTPSTASTYSSSLNKVAIEDEKDMESFGYYGNNWDDLSSVVEFVVKSPLV
ncbi:hypothetical protein Cgig2_011969 [Carnegiea gigantea]|uniref:NAC domain-containing protein n=1 Tax=Carnegiea gigantea TaxID=171969 RepID=A0A9Q1JFG4_9CARY|nr:hypothetical protein Cgig2_011969 [Carnegiea gigantea]